MNVRASALDWLAHLRPAVPELDERDWNVLTDLDGRLREPTTEPTTETETEIDDGPPVSNVRARWLLHMRSELAHKGLATLTVPAEDGGEGRPPVLQTLMQFVCGFHDLDYRDATGLVHGAMALELASSTARRTWLDRIRAGALVGIAATERHGGSRVREITTRAEARDDGRWSLYGEKVWVSRLDEAQGFVLFFRDPEGTLSAALLEADLPGIVTEPTTPSGLGGWAWGTLRLHDVVIDPETTLIDRTGAGMEVFARHFTRFRPLVTATALGAAAAAHTAVSRTLGARYRIGVIPRIRDNAYILLARTYGEIVPALLMAMATSRLAADGDPAADLWARVGKASGVDVACRAVNELLPLVGAGGFRAASRLIKARNDLTALTYADGIHDGLYRSVGRSLIDETDRRTGRSVP